MNSITFAGNLAADPVLRTSANGKNYATFRVAVDDNRPDDKRVTHWISVVAPGKLGENIAASLREGHRVIVVGRFTSNTRSLGVPNDQGIYEAKNITELSVVARSVGPDMLWQTAVVTKVASNNGNQAPAGQPVQQYAPQAPQGQPVYQPAPQGQPVQQYAPQAPQGQPVYQQAPQGQPVQQYTQQAPQGQPVYQQPVVVPNLAANDF